MSEPVGVLLVAAGAGLVYSALTGQNPVTELRKALSSGTVDGRPEPGEGFGASILAGLTRVGTISDRPKDDDAGSSTPAGGGSWPADPANLVSIGQGGHRLAAPAAQQFRAWENSYGRVIKVSDSYRSTAQQRAAHERDPRRFAAPGSGAHPEGRAVDVDLAALGIVVTGPPPNWLTHAGYRKLYQTAQANGWCNYQVQNGSTGGKIPEPWHFSYQVCK